MTELSTKAFVGIVRTNVDCFLSYVVIEWIFQFANPINQQSPGIVDVGDWVYLVVKK